MSTQTLRPNGTVSAGAWARTGGSTKHGVLADDSDGTYLSQTDLSIAVFALSSYALGSGERVKQARARLRADTGGTLQSAAEFRFQSGGSVEGWSSHDSGGSVSTLSGPWLTDLISASDQQAVLDGLQVAFRALANGAVDVDVHEAYLDLEVWERTDAPTVSTDPAGAGGPPPVIGNSDRPVVESYTSALNDGTPGQWSRQVRVFRDAVYGGGGFDAATEDDVEWEDLDTAFGEPSTASGAPDTVQVGDQLANNDTYRAYVRYGKNNVAGETLWSQWGYAEFELSLTLPTAPAIDLTVDEANGRNTIEVTTAAATHDTVEAVRVQRTDDGGATWSTIRDGYLTDVAASTAYTFQDYDAPRDVEVQYRARTVEGITSSGTTLTSTWATSAVDEHPSDGRWWVYPVDQFDDLHAGVRVAVGPDEQIMQAQGVFRPPTRKTAIVVSGQLHGDDGSYEVNARGVDECAAIEILAKFTGTVLVKDPFGVQKYVQWTGRDRTRLGTPSEPRHVWGLSYVEVDDDIGVDG